MKKKVMEAYETIMNAKSVVEAYDARRVAYESLTEEEADTLYNLLRKSGKRTNPETVSMGLNTTRGDDGWEDLKQRICTIVERDGICNASWSCSGRTRHQWQSEVLAEDMPEYSFDIEYSTYKCEIRKKELS